MEAEWGEMVGNGGKGNQNGVEWNQNEVKRNQNGVRWWEMRLNGTKMG